MKKDKLKNSVSKKRSLKESKPLIEDAYRKIKLLIFHRKLIPGQRLVYDDLAKMLEMSRTPIINALNRLEQQRLVASESYRGFSIKPMGVEEAWDAFGLREALESYAVVEAIQKGDLSQIMKLEEKLTAYDNHQSSHYDQKKISLDGDFHLQIAEMSRNQILKWHVKINLEHLYLRANLDHYKVSRIVEASREHQRLFNHMKKKDIPGSVEIIRNHVRNDREHVIACLSQQEPGMEEDILEVGP